MENKQPLLSICIPTYNGGEKLRVTLHAVFNAVKNHQYIEVIVSDNCSTDNTQDILSEFSEKVQLKTYRNQQNLGFNRNMFLLVDKYATGQYCWVIGDDDFIDEDSLSHICPILAHGRIDYLSIKHRLLKMNDYETFIFVCRDSITFEMMSFAEAIDMNTCQSNVLGTFMSSSIFLKEKVNSFSKKIFSDCSWDNYYSTFPNSYLMCNLFHSSECGCITTPLFTALISEKSWDDKMNLICYRYLPQLYRFCKDIGLNMKRLKSNEIIIQQLILERSVILLKNSLYSEIYWGKFLKVFLYLNTYRLIFNKIYNKWLRRK